MSFRFVHARFRPSVLDTLTYLGRRRELTTEEAVLLAMHQQETAAAANGPRPPRPPPPPWLGAIARSTSPAPTLYAVRPENLGGGGSLHWRPADRDDDPLRIYILGVGNIGRFYAATLAQYHNAPPITLVVRTEETLRRWMASPGIELTPHGGGRPRRHIDFAIETWSEKPPPAGPVHEVASGGTIGRLIVATKAQDALAVVDSARAYLGPASTVVFGQNGMCKLWLPHGTAYLRARYPARGGGEDSDGVDHSRHPSYGALVTTHGVTSCSTPERPFASIHASSGTLAAGPVVLNPQHAGSAIEFLRMFEGAAFSGVLVEDCELWARQLEKLYLNSVVNPISAVLRCRNGDLFEGAVPAPVTGLVDALAREAARVLRRHVAHHSTYRLQKAYAAWADPSATQPLRDRFADGPLRRLLDRVGHVVRDNISSMLHDVRAGRPTEIRDLNGWIVDTAAEVNLTAEDVACHAKIIELIQSEVALRPEDIPAQFPALRPPPTSG